MLQGRREYFPIAHVINILTRRLEFYVLNKITAQIRCMVYQCVFELEMKKKY